MKPSYQACLVSAALFTCYAFTAAPGCWFGDSAELAAAAAQLGVAHPPGYSLYLLLAKLSLTGGGDAYRMNLMSALFAAVAAGILYWILLRAGRSSGAALFGATLLGLSPLFWSLATVAEVYPLSMTMLLAIVPAALREPWSAGLLLASYVAGVGAAHHPIGIFYLPPLAIWVVLRRGRCPVGRKIVATACMLFLLPWTVHLYLPIRAAGDAIVRWGDPSTVSGLWRHISRAGYGDLLHGGTNGIPLLSRLALPWSYVYDDFGLPVLSLALIGAASLIRTRKREGTLLLFFLVLATVCLPALLHVEDTAVSIEGNRVFFLPFAAALCALAALAAVSIGRLAGRRLLPWLFLLLLAPSLPGRFARHDLSDDHAAGDLARVALGPLDRGASLYVDEGQLLFPVIYAQTVLSIRPDVRVTAPRGVIHPRAKGGGGRYFSSRAGAPPGTVLVPWGIVQKEAKPGEPVRWNGGWDRFDLRARPYDRVDTMEREVLFGFHLRYAANLFRAGRSERAMAELDNAALLADRADEGWVHMAKAYRDAGRPAEAAAMALRAVDRAPRSWRTRMIAGVSLVGAGELHPAEAQLREAIRLAPGEGEPYLYLAELLVRLGRREEAVDPARKGIALLPGHPLAAALRREMAKEGSPR